MAFAIRVAPAPLKVKGTIQRPVAPIARPVGIIGHAGRGLFGSGRPSPPVRVGGPIRYRAL